MKHGNLFAAGLTAATFVALALLPLTKEALRFDMQMAAGKPVLGRALVDLGIRQENMPLGGIGPKLTAAPDTAAARSTEFPVQLANATQLPGREKWAALQQLVVTYPENLAGHAALARMACKNGGSVEIGHMEQQSLLFPKPMQKGSSTVNLDDPQIMLRSCEAGERLDPDNAYFPAMAAIAHLALNEDSAAHAAIHRAAEKPNWREYIDVEAQGKVRRAALLNGPQNTLSESAVMACILFPHYASLRGMARVVTGQAIERELAGDAATGLALRRDMARIGSTMQAHSSNLIGGLVGMAIIRVTEGRPGGAPLREKNDHHEDDVALRQRRDAQFLAYLEAQGAQADADRYSQYFKAEAESKAISHDGVHVSVFGTPTLLESQWQIFANMFLLGAATLLSILGGLALLRPWLDYRTGRAAFFLALLGIFAVVAWGTWQTLGNFRDILAFGSTIQGLSGSEDSAFAQAEFEALRRAIYLQGGLGLIAFLTPPVYLCLVAFLAKRHRLPISTLLQRWTLPLAALLTLAYAVHLTGYALREHTIRAELQHVLTHEGRYMAEKLGKVWPIVRE